MNQKTPTQDYRTSQGLFDTSQGGDVKQIPSCLGTKGCLIQVVWIFRLWFAMSILMNVVFFAANMSHMYHCLRLLLRAMPLCFAHQFTRGRVPEGEPYRWKQIAGEHPSLHIGRTSVLTTAKLWKDTPFLPKISKVDLRTRDATCQNSPSSPTGVILSEAVCSKRVQPRSVDAGWVTVAYIPPACDRLPHLPVFK